MAELTEAQASLRDTLGLPADADADAVMAAAMEALAKAKEPAEPAAPQVTQITTPPEGMALVDSATLEEMKVAAARGAAWAERAEAEERRRTVAAAVADGRIPPARMDHWERSLKADPEGFGKALENMPKGLIPVAAMGHSATGALDGQVSAAALEEQDSGWVVPIRKYSISATGTPNNGVEA